VAVECPARQGPAHLRGLLHRGRSSIPETGEQLPDGGGRLPCHHRAVQDRITAVPVTTSWTSPTSCPKGERCECGSWLRRMGPFAGRGDNMVKLRGCQRVARGARRAGHGPSVGGARLLRAGGGGENNRDELILAVVSEADPRPVRHHRHRGGRHAQGQAGREDRRRSGRAGRTRPPHRGEHPGQAESGFRDERGLTQRLGRPGQLTPLSTASYRIGKRCGDGSIAAAGIAVKVRRDPTDSFC